ncbi:MAG: SDR family NAD(P)-dependent oxidoreductase [Alphaproteobacteria bacterium]|nr:SDR family NAD(P)-dependent oxidoreductase [Alphaproteobacteria bacterium]
MLSKSLQGKSVLVTGADGFIGSHLCETLVGQGANVRALSAYTSFGTRGWLDMLEPCILNEMDVISGDIRDSHFVDRLVEGQSIVLHLAALIAIPYSYVAPQSYVDVNVTGTLNVLEACRRHSIERMVHTSTSEVYGTALFTPITEAHPLQGQSPYSASKIGADYMVQAYHRSFDLPAVILRPFNTYGPRQSERAVIPTLIRQYLDPDCPVVEIGDLSPIRDFNYVQDTADAFAEIAVAGDISYGQAYNAGSGRGVTIGDVAEMIRTLTGANKPLKSTADRTRPVKSEVFELLADSNLLSSKTTWRTRTPLNSGIEKTIEWWREEFTKGRIRQSSGYLI